MMYSENEDEMKDSEKMVDEIVEEISEETNQTNIENKEGEPKVEDFTNFLVGIGLQHKVDYVFLQYAQLKSREMIKQMKENTLNFMFDLAVTDYSDRFFPLATWLEKINTKNFIINDDPDSEQLTQDKNYHILWHTAPSKIFQTREILTPNDFHLYFLDVVKPKNYEENFSAEELYRVIDQKRGQTYFLVINNRRSSHQDGMFIVLFINDKHIIPFHIPKKTLHGTYDENGAFSSWVALDERFEHQVVNEFAIFSLPDGNFVLSKEEALKLEEKENETDCEMCGS